jgi:hypothetical protein
MTAAQEESLLLSAEGSGLAVVRAVDETGEHAGDFHEVGLHLLMGAALKQVLSGGQLE